MTLQRKIKRAKKKKSSKGSSHNEQLQKIMDAAVGYHKSGDIEKATILYKKILEVLPNNADILHLQGVAEYQAGNLSNAVSMIVKAISLNPDVPAFYNNLGNALLGLQEKEEAVKAYKKTLQLDPLNIGAINNIGAALHELGQWQEEIQYYKQGLQINPNDFALLNELVKTQSDACDWDGLDANINKLIEATKNSLSGNKAAPLSPYHSLSIPIDLSLQKKLVETYVEKKFGHIKPAFELNKSKKEKLKIGYVSSDFRNHPTAHLMNGLFKLHDRNKFEVYTFAMNPEDGSSYRKSIKENSDHFIEIAGINSVKIAELINGYGIDILVDVMGHIQNSRPEIFAMRPAPVQINFLAYPGTTGARFIDYLVTDHIVIPQENEEYYSEKLIFMPDTYFVTDNKQLISRPKTKVEYGLPEDKFIFCCFNKTNKIDAKVFAVWLEILKAVPDSVLWLLSDNDFVKDNLRKYAAKKNISPERIIFASRMPKEEHLARYKVADLFLDCFAVTAHTTAVDCLWAGLPIITLLGDRIISRASASILKACNMQKLVAKNIDEYKQIILSYANDSKLLNNLKKELSYGLFSTALFGTEKYVKNLEEAYLKTFDIYSSNKEIKNIEIG